MRCRGHPKARACLAIADSLRKVSGNENKKAVKMRPKLLLGSTQHGLSAEGNCRSWGATLRERLGVLQLTKPGRRTEQYHWN